MILNSLLLFGVYYCFDFNTIFEEALLTLFNIDTFQLSWIYSAATLPTIFTSPLTAQVLSRIGYSYGGVLLSAVNSVSIFFSFFGCRYKLYWMMIVSAVLFGFSTEGLQLTQIALIEKWYSGRYLTIAFGFANQASFLASAIASWTNPIIYVRSRDLLLVSFVCSAVGFSGWVCAIFNWLQDQKLSRLLQADSSKDMIASLSKKENTILNE